MSSNYTNSGTTITAPRADAVLMARPGTDDLQIYLDTHFGNKVGIGTDSPQSKLHTVQTLDTVSNTLANGNYGLVVAGNVAGVATDTVGIHLAAKSVSGTPTRGASILAEVQSTGNNHDLIFATSAVSAAPAERMRINSSGDVKINESLGIGVAASSTTGRLDCSNDVVAFSTSDERLKQNIKPLDNALDKIKKINGVSFDWKELTEEEKKTIQGNEGHDVGVIAQEIEEVLPEVVTERNNGYKAVKYEKIVPLLIEAIKEQQQQIEELKNG